MRLDQLTDGLNSTEPSVVCTTLRKFRQEVYLAYADDTEEKRDHDVEKAVDEASFRTKQKLSGELRSNAS